MSRWKQETLRVFTIDDTVMNDEMWGIPHVDHVGIAMMLHKASSEEFEWEREICKSAWSNVPCVRNKGGSSEESS